MVTVNPTDASRQLVFLSHANPEDNDFAQWLSLQLTQHGYEVWCDVANLIGGEDFWRDIETAIRDGAAKFLFVLSRISNTKSGPENELAVARITARRIGSQDFIIPLLIDDLPHGDMNIEIARLNAIPFHPNWASGLARLLAKLEEDSVFRRADSQRATVAAWWRAHFSPDAGLTQDEEIYASNWFEITPQPETLFFHELSRSQPGATVPDATFSYPVVPHGGYLISLADAGLLSSELPETHRIARSLDIGFGEFLSDAERVANIDRRDRRNIITTLLRQSWELFADKAGLYTYALANERKCMFRDQTGEKAMRTPFRGVSGTTGFRALTGYRTVSGPTPDSKKKRFWHFAISMKPLAYPILGFAAYYHVLFSDDGRTPWTSADRMHAARRRQCSDWWNDDWRDRILAFLASLSRESESLSLPAGAASLQLSLMPVLFESPCTYEAPRKTPLHIAANDVERAGEEESDEPEEIDDDDPV